MKKLTFNDIEKQGLSLYKYIRGSHLYGLNTETSDMDTGGVYYAPIEHIIGVGYDYQDEISDDKHDNVFYELKKFLHLLSTSNPTILEALFVDDEHIIYESPIIKSIKEHRDMFLTKELYMPFVGYASSQIHKAVGLHKLCQNPITDRKQPLDFCFTYYKQGSSSILNWLSARNLKQEHCGLVSINHMPDNYSVFYDWGAQFENESIGINDLVSELQSKDETSNMYRMVKTIISTYKLYECEDIVEALCNWYDKYSKPFGYRGIQKENGNDIRCSSIIENEPPICYICYNRDAYVHHCKKYKEYTDWLKNRNEHRYEENKEKTWDSKNVMHCMRLLTMAEEILSGKGVMLNRKLVGDYDFFMKIRRHEFEYDCIMNIMKNKLEDVKVAYENTTLPEKVDKELIDKLLIDARMKLSFNTNHQSLNPLTSSTITHSK